MKLPLPPLKFAPDGLTEGGYTAEYAEKIRASMPDIFATLSEWYEWAYNGAPSDIVGDMAASSCTLMLAIFEDCHIKENVGSAKTALMQDGFSLLYFNRNGKGRGVEVKRDADYRHHYTVSIAAPGRGEPTEFYCHTEREAANILVSFFRTAKTRKL